MQELHLILVLNCKFPMECPIIFYLQSGKWWHVTVLSVKEFEKKKKKNGMKDSGDENINRKLS